MAESDPRNVNLSDDGEKDAARKRAASSSSLNFKLDMIPEGEAFDPASVPVAEPTLPLHTSIADANPDELDNSDVANLFATLDRRDGIDEQDLGPVLLAD